MKRVLLCSWLFLCGWCWSLAASAAPVVADDALDGIANAVEACTIIGGAGLMVLVLVRSLRLLREALN